MITLPRLSTGEKDGQSVAQPRVAVVDDNEINLAAYKRTLSRQGWYVDTFASAAGLLAVLASDPYRYDLIITDLAMKGLSGIELSTRIKKIRSNLPIILISGHTRPSEQALGASGVDRFLAKPFRALDLIDMAVELIQQGDGNSQ